MEACLVVATVQVLQRYFTPHSAAMAEYALANAVINRVKSHRATTAEGSRLSPVQSIGDREGTLWLLPLLCSSIQSVARA